MAKSKGLSRTFRLSVLVVFLFLPSLKAQDISVRVEAVRLLDRANALSSTRQIDVNYRVEAAFRAFGVDGTEKDGRFSAIFAGDIERYEWFFGNYHSTSIHYPDKIVQGAHYEPPPPETLEMGRLSPVLIGWFDKSDVIESIDDTTVAGRPTKCIEFETVNGRQAESNQICIDTAEGTLARWNVGKERIEDTDYSLFQGAWLPSHIEQYIDGQLRMVVDQTFSVVQGVIDWTSLTPRETHTLRPCHQYKDPVMESASQPAGAGPGPWYDVEVHAVIGSDGHVRDAAVLPEGKPDLEAKALQIVSRWTFSPAVCNGKPVPVATSLVVHFPPQ